MSDSMWPTRCPTTRLGHLSQASSQPQAHAVASLRTELSDVATDALSGSATSRPRSAQSGRIVDATSCADMWRTAAGCASVASTCPSSRTATVLPRSRRSRRSSTRLQHSPTASPDHRGVTEAGALCCASSSRPEHLDDQLLDAATHSHPVDRHPTVDLKRNEPGPGIREVEQFADQP